MYKNCQFKLISWPCLCFLASCLLFSFNLSANPLPPSIQYLESQNQFLKLGSAPIRSELTQVTSLKVAMDLASDTLYYINTQSYALHYDFATKGLGYPTDIRNFNAAQYRTNPNRRFLFGTLNYFHNRDLYTLHLSQMNDMNCDEIRYLYARIENSSFLQNKLHYQLIRSDRDVCDFPRQISKDDLYKGQTYQALNTGVSYGYLRRIKIQDLDKADVGRQDILLLDGIPNDVSVVAGIITTEFQTMLSHINVLSINRKTPNMALRGAWDMPDLHQFEDTLVRLRVGPNTYKLEPADLKDAQAYWASKVPAVTTYLSKFTDLQGLVELEDANHDFTDIIGGKAANFGELLNAGATTPEDYFAVPFFYYKQHMLQSGLDKTVSKMLNDPEFQANSKYRKSTLKDLRKKIRAAPVDPQLVSLIHQRLDNFRHFASYRFRSSTNAEDLAFFSGAGLYDSTSAKRDHPKKTVERALKKVWASLWAWRAYEERSFYNIDHKTVAMSVLVNRSFPDEDANGVLITRNLFAPAGSGRTNPGFTINVAHKEFSIVAPEDGYENDQILLHPWSIDPDKNFEIEYISRTNRPGFVGQPAMTDAELRELGRQAMAIKKHYYSYVPHDARVPFNDFTLEMEFKVDSLVSPRRVYIKQVRPLK